MNIATTNLNWDNDVVKHFVRQRAWLPAALSQASTTRGMGREPKYLTFCAAQALDVFLLLKEGVLIRDESTNCVLNTYFCEKNAAVFGEITRLIGSAEQGFLGDFADMVLFKEDSETEGKSLDDVATQYPRNLRNRLSTKDRHLRLRSAVPFDVINLDICGTFFPPSGGVLSPMLESIRTLLDWQTDSADEEDGFGSFTLFLTAHVESGRVNPEAFHELITMVEDNREVYVEFARAWEKRFGTNDVPNTACKDFVGFYCAALPKVIISDAFRRGWLAKAQFSGLYSRPRENRDGQKVSEYSMLGWVGRFDKYVPEPAPLGLPQTTQNREYARLIGELTSEPTGVQSAVEAVRDDVANNLEQVKAFRESYLTGITEAN